MNCVVIQVQVIGNCRLHVLKVKKIKYKVCLIIAIENASPHGYTTIIGFWHNVLLKISDLLLI